MLINYSDHKRWIWFTSALLLFALGLYSGLGRTAPGESVGAASVRLDFRAMGTAFIGVGALLGGLQWVGRLMGWLQKGHGADRLIAVLCPLIAGVGLAALGVHVGQRWATVDGRTANSLMGMCYGILGYACMVFAGLLSALRRAPSWWGIGSRTWWLKGHIWLGMLSGALILFHSGLRLGGYLEQLLWILLVLVIGSGVAGLVLQQFVPYLLTKRILTEIPFEQIPHECQVLRDKADDLIEALCEPGSPASQTADAKPKEAKLDTTSRHILQETYNGLIRPFLGEAYDRSSPLARSQQAEAVFEDFRAAPRLQPIASELTQLETFCKDRWHMGEQQRLHYWLHLWLFVHIPLSVLLLILGAVHGFWSLYY